MEIDFTQLIGQAAIYVLGLASTYVIKLRRDVNAAHVKIRKLEDYTGINHKQGEK